MKPGFWKYILSGVVILGLVSLGFFAAQKINEEQKELEQQKALQQAEQSTVLGRARAELAKNTWTSGALVTTYEDAKKTLNITDETDPGQGLDQDLFKTSPDQILQQSYNLFVRAGQGVFKVEGIDKIVVIRRIPVTTGAGIATMTEVVRISIVKDKFQSVDWNSLEGRPIAEPIKNAAQEHYIDTGLERNIPNINILTLLPG